jgi:hypothetical protein
MFAERFIVYTQTVEDVNGTVMGRVFKFAMDIPGLNFISIAMHSMTTDRFSACSANLLSFITLSISKNVKEMIKGAAKSFLVTTGL